MNESDGNKEIFNNDLIEKTDERTESISIEASINHLQEQLLQAENDRQNGIQGYSVDQVSRMMRDAIREVLNG